MLPKFNYNYIFWYFYKENKPYQKVFISFLIYNDMWVRHTDKTISNISTIPYMKGTITVGLNNKNYPVRKIKGKWYLQHQLVALNKYNLKAIPKDFEIHHINPEKKKKNFNHPDNLIIVHKNDHNNIHKLMRKLKE